MTSTVIVYIAPVLADSTVNTTGRVCPISTDGGSKMTSSVRMSLMTAKVALLPTSESAGLRRYWVKDSSVLALAGIVMAVTAGSKAALVAAARDVAEAELDGPTTVTRTSTVYTVPVGGDDTVKITGSVTPMRAAGGSKMTSPRTVVEMVAKTASAERMTSSPLRRYAVKDMTVFWFAGIMMAVTAGTALEVAVARAELGPMTVTRTVMV